MTSKVHSIRFALSLFVFSIGTAAANNAVTETEIAAKVNSLLSQMTLEEKIGQMTQVDFDVISVPEAENTGNPLNQQRLENALFNYHVGSILNTPYNKAQPVETWRTIMTAINETANKTRLKIPLLYGIDAVHGATYTQNAVLFPQAINMAATFNSELSTKEGEITAKAVKASGQNWNFYPVMDVGRQALWPRLWETYGEDVYLTTALATAYIKGHQGDDFSAADKAPTCLKHYIGYSVPINGKDRTPAWISERILREYFLPPFEAGIKAGSPTIMVNSGEVDGIPGHANYQYLTTILRGELGFKGIAVSDWEDIKRLYQRDKLAASPREAVKIAVMAGVDMSMVPNDFSFYDLLLDLVKSGEVPESRINEAVSRILSVKYKAGLFEPAQAFLSVKNNLINKDAVETNQQAAQESIILSKNEQNILPLKKETKLLVTGYTANLLSVLNGGWTITWQGDNEALYPKDKPTVLAAIQQKSKGKVTYIGQNDFGLPVNTQQLIEEAKNHDVILLCLGEKPYAETLGNIESLLLEPQQIELARAAISTGKPVVLLMLGGRPRIITEISQQVNAVILGFLPGMEGGAAIADILYGDINPSGKLPITYPRNTNAVVLYDHKPVENYEPNFYNPLYPFGHGLSYTQFNSYGLAVDKPVIKMGESVKVSVKVKNTGARKGKEAVLLYLNDVAASVSRPNKQLKGFKKVELNPNEEQELNFTLTPQDLSFIGVDLKRTVEPGEFKVMVGNETVSFVVEK